jgi:hypothetical protein
MKNKHNYFYQNDYESLESVLSLYMFSKSFICMGI